MIKAKEQSDQEEAAAAAAAVSSEEVGIPSHIISHTQELPPDWLARWLKSFQTVLLPDQLGSCSCWLLCSREKAESFTVYR